MPTDLLFKGLTAPTAAAPKRAVKLADEGIVTAIVAVTGVVDEVNDLIVPGAFTWTLKRRTPKVVDDHEWKNKAGRVLHAEEWLPGDRRLPKRTKDGKPWPAEAGALVATMQYHLGSPVGADSFSWVKFYAESNEAEFSIGYKVPDGKARIRRDQVRVILMVDLFEFSHVLFGAAPLSMALEVKNLHSLTGGTVTHPVGLTADKPKKKAGDEQAIAAFEETDPPNIDTDAEWDEPQDHQDVETGRKAGMEAKTAASVLFEAKSGGWDRNKGNAEQLRKWYLSPASGIGWGTDGDKTRCHAIASKHMSPDDAWGYCQLRHKEATGTYDPDHGVEGKTAELGATEGKSMNTMKGSFEERQGAITRAAEELFETFTPDEHCPPCLSLVATYPGEVIIRQYVGNDTRAYLVPYSLDDESGGVDLGEPQPVSLALVAQVSGDDEGLEASEEEVEELALQSLLTPLATVGQVARMEGKTGDLIRNQLVALMDGVRVKSADQPEPNPADEDTTTPADAPTEEPVADEDLITVDTLPEGDWGSYRKTEPIRAMHVDEPFSVETREGPVHVDDEDGGWLAIDSDGYPYPIADEEFENVYAEDTTPSEGEDPDPEADPELVDDEPAADAEPVGTDEDGEKVTLAADEHFANMDALDAGEDPESTDDDDE